MSKELNIECPSCSSDKKVPHEVLHAGKKLVIRCTLCRTTQQVGLPHRSGYVKLKVVVSDFDKSRLSWLELEGDEQLHIGDEFIVEGTTIDAVRITAIELSDGIRALDAEAKSVRVLWAQKIDKVIVRVAVHSGKTTTSYKLPFDGEKSFVVGARGHLGYIIRIKMKQGPVLDRDGQDAQAKDIARIYIKSKNRRSEG